jgi:hypothetical protein
LRMVAGVSPRKSLLCAASELFRYSWPSTTAQYSGLVGAVWPLPAPAAHQPA